jgi:hypothetical protein
MLKTIHIVLRLHRRDHANLSSVSQKQSEGHNEFIDPARRKNWTKKMPKAGVDPNLDNFMIECKFCRPKNFCT